MGEEILFISNSKMKKYIPVIFLIFTIFCSRKDWIRKLPDKDYSKDQIINGTFIRHTNPKSAINSTFHKNHWNEKILFDKNIGKFEKIYERTDIMGNEKKYLQIRGRGNFYVKGNWIILKTEEIAETNSEDTDSLRFDFKKHDLLYHYDENTQTIIPMIYESGYIEKPFGVMDGVKLPYMEDKYFYISRKNFLLKDFQSHAYFQVK